MPTEERIVTFAGIEHSTRHLHRSLVRGLPDTLACHYDCRSHGTSLEGARLHSIVDKQIRLREVEVGRMGVTWDEGADTRRRAVERDRVAKTDRIAADNRLWLAERGVLMLNLVGSAGAGKTALLESTIGDLRGVDCCVIEGDPATRRDAERIERAGCRVLQINTGSGCHLDAKMIEGALEELRPEPGGVVFVENVGSLACPAHFDLGERSKVVVMSVTEGEDKPLKYPHAFRSADVCVFTKIDLLPHLDFDLAECTAHARVVNPDIEILSVSTRRLRGVDRFGSWVRVRAGACQPSEYAYS